MGKYKLDYKNSKSNFTPDKKVVVVEDKELGLVIEVPYGPSILKKAEIISEYEIQFLYEDGSSRISKILM